MNGTVGNYTKTLTTISIAKQCQTEKFVEQKYREAVHKSDPHFGIKFSKNSYASLKNILTKLYNKAIQPLPNHYIFY